MIGQAAITNGEGKVFIDQITINSPKADEVLVEIKASGVCHTDWDSLNWGKSMIIGHEGAGVVLAKGEEVMHVEVGDPVLLNWAISCGDCFQCRNGNLAICETYSPVTALAPADGHAHPGASLWQDKPIERSFNIGTLSSHTVVRREAVIKIEDDIPFASAAIVGCGVMTGYGSAINAAKVKPGSSVVVIGCGGVGLNVIQGARIAGAERVIAIDLKDTRLEMAKQFGATHLIQSSREDKNLSQSFEQVKELTEGRGADYAFECTGVPALGASPLLMTRNGGTAVQVSGIEEELTIDMNLFEWDKVYMNPLYGKCNPTVDFPRIFRLYKKGDLLLDELITQTYSLDQVELVFQHMLEGRNAKGVILF